MKSEYTASIAGNETNSFLPALAFSGLGALAILFLELLKVHQSPHFVPMATSELVGILAAFGAYWIVLAILSCGVVGLLRLRGKALPYLLIHGIVNFCLTLLLLWRVGFFHAELAPLPWRGVVLAFTLLFLGGGFLTHKNCFSWQRWTASWAAATIIGLQAQGAILSAFVFHTERALFCARLSLLWTFVAGGGLLLFSVIRTRRLYRVALVLVWGLFCCATPLLVSEWRNGGLRFSDGSRPEKPNLLFISVDALRADVCSSYGGEIPTPTLDALASEGTLFEQAYSLAPWTVPSMTGLFLSDYPAGPTPNENKENWRREMTFYDYDPPGQTLAESLKAQGYATAVIFGNPLLKNYRGFKRGFDQILLHKPRTALAAGLWARTPFFHAMLRSIAPTLAPMRPLDISRITTFQAQHILRRNRHKNFFLWVHHFDPHSPYDPPARYGSMEGPWPLFAPSMPDWGTPLLDLFDRMEIEEAHKPYVRSLYHGEVQYVDECIGTLLDELETLHIREQLYICLTSDHGEQLWDHGAYGHGQSLYEEELHVPLIFTGPAISSQRIDTPVSCIDLMPTLADLMGIPQDTAWRGVSLRPTLEHAAPVSRDLPTFAQGTYLYTWPKPMQMVRDGDYKLIRETDATQAQLYNVSQDPQERTDIATARQSEVKRLMGILDSWEEMVQVTLVKPDFIDENSIQESQEQLRALGYME